MPPTVHAELLVDLCARYREPQRHYHTLEHVAELLALLEQLRSEASRPDLLAWAIWFHDAVYDPHRSDNEAASAALARASLSRLRLAPDDCTQVSELVLATANHHAQPALGNVALFLDLDLSILGAPEARYLAYTQQVRAEYAFVPEQTFRLKRGAFLKTWLARPRLYFTDVCHGLFDGQARQNLARELSLLASVD